MSTTLNERSALAYPAATTERPETPKQVGEPCCAANKKATCCEPAAKSSCCGPSGNGGKGCC
jgi:hypothetical protein